MDSPLKYFADLRDPRVERTREHLLEEILLIAISALDPEELEKGFAAWVSSIAKLTAGEVVAIDGKALRGTSVPGKKAIVHMVSAWANTNGLVLAQRRVDEKSNEITAIPKLLDALELSGTVVTIDAMGCQRAIAEKIAAKKADYILAV